MCVLACTVFQSRISSIRFARRISVDVYPRSIWLRDLRSRANISREHAEEKKRKVEGSGRSPECCVRVPVGDNLKVRKGESIRYTGKMKSRGGGRRKNGARTGYVRITVYRTNISLLLDQTFFILSLFLFPFRTPEGETPRAKRRERVTTHTSRWQKTD